MRHAHSLFVLLFQSHLFSYFVCPQILVTYLALQLTTGSHMRLEPIQSHVMTAQIVRLIIQFDCCFPSIRWRSVWHANDAHSFLFIIKRKIFCFSQRVQRAFFPIGCLSFSVMNFLCEDENCFPPSI